MEAWGCGLLGYVRHNRINPDEPTGRPGIRIRLNNMGLQNHIPLLLTGVVMAHVGSEYEAFFMSRVREGLAVQAQQSGKKELEN